MKIDTNVILTDEDRKNHKKRVKEYVEKGYKVEETYKVYDCGIKKDKYRTILWKQG